MRSRRGEVPFVASRVGRSYDPREVLGLARDLRVERATALGYVILWEELILEVGDALSGRIKGYRAEDIAAKLGCAAKPRVLVEALKRAGLLSTHRGVFFHSYWRQSITGQYANDRAALRERWRLKQAERRAGDVSEMSPRQEGDVHPLSPETSDIDRSINGVGAGTPPPTPPRAGGSLGASRWEWLLAHHKRCENSQACTRYLGAMTEENWALVQWISGLPARGGGLISLSKKRVLALSTYKLLAREAFLQLRPEWLEKLAQDRRPPAPATREHDPELKEKRDAAKRAAESAVYVLAQLADANLSEIEKQRAKTRWMGLHPTITPPWEETAGASA